jgi:3-oxoacyl-[acyl-carrier protein] reductase
MASTGRWAVVTGASSGIGKATALAFADDGWNVMLHFRRSRDAAERAFEEVSSRGVRALLLQADLGASAACSSLVEEAWEATGGVDAWFHNAGADTLTGDEAAYSFERKLELLTRVDLWGSMLACRAIGRKMKERGRGAIVTMGWDQASTGMEGDSGELFAAVKGGVMAFTRSLAKSLAPTVRVNGVAPGWIRTSWGHGASHVWQERVLRETPLKRWGEPDDVAKAVAFLASDRAQFMTGQILDVNGGAVMG